MRISLFTIGYTKTTAEYFFSRLIRAGVRRLIDIRISNRSQLAGFAKMPDLAFFLNNIAGIEYHYEPLLAPPLEMMRAYRDGALQWEDYQSDYRALLTNRRVESELNPKIFDQACLLCSEASADYCHRRLATHYLKEKWAHEVTINHL